ncbi:MAG: hypothetical protein A2Y38_04995 [Spirochaetes bacterium GWB1_59_5]|nr:MAG: hypothetical protein A2Y38_04995 [Spirochaetes bacterium GWB1_59_5]
MRQFNRVDVPARIVYLESDALPMAGVDSFVSASGRMHIKMLNFITVADSTGPEMDRSAFVTFLNDLVLCPIAYVSLPIEWKELDHRRAELSMTHEGLRVKAILTFESDGRLLNWESEDRYADVKGKSLADRWSTPFTGSVELSGLVIPASGVGIHDYDGTPYVYVELDRIQSLVLGASGLPPEQ